MIIGNCLFCGKEYIKRARKYNFCSVICSNSFNKNGLIDIKLPPENEELAEFVGILLGDGYVSKYQTSVILNSIADKDYILYVVNLISKLFPKVKISLIKRKNDKALDIRFNSIIISKYFIEMGIVANNKIIPQWILNDNNFKIACLRGLFDTEGSISFKVYEGKEKVSVYKQLNFRNTNSEIIVFARDALISLGFDPTMTLKHSIYLSNNISIANFREKVGFNNPKLYLRSEVNTFEEYLKFKNLT